MKELNAEREPQTGRKQTEIVDLIETETVENGNVIVLYESPVQPEVVLDIEEAEIVKERPSVALDVLSKTGRLSVRFAGQLLYVSGIGILYIIQACLAIGSWTLSELSRPVEDGLRRTGQKPVVHPPRHSERTINVQNNYHIQDSQVEINNYGNI